MILVERAQAISREHGWLLAGLALVLLPHFFHLPISITVFCILTFAWRVLNDFRLLNLPPRWLRLLLIALGVALVYATYHTVLGRQAGVSLLAIMLCLKLLEMRNARDKVVTIFLGYFIVIAGFLFDQSLLIGLYMFAVLIALTAALIALYSTHSPAIGARRQARLATTLLLQALPIAGLLFLLFPRIPGPLWGLPEDAFARTGLSDTMAPGLISELAIDDSAAFRVEFSGEEPEKGQMYWRGPMFWHYDGRTWSTPEGPAFTTSEPYQTLGEPVAYTVLLEPHDQRWLFALDLVATPPPDSELLGAHQLLSKNPVKRLTRYTARSYPSYQLAAEEPPNPARYLQVPAGYALKARTLANQWRRTSTDDQAIVQQGLNYLRTQPFFYTLSAPLLLDDPVDDFLFDTRRGFCEHFASSFTILMRQAGVPARIVTGYQGGETNPLGEYWLIRQSDAHAWVEVWLRNRGWVRIDPTAVIPPERVDVPQALARNRALQQEGNSALGEGWAGQLAAQLRFGWDSLNHNWKEWVVEYNQSRQQSLLETLGLEKTNWQHLIGLLTATLSLAAIALSLIVFRRQRREYDYARRLYDRFCAKLAKRGLQRDPAEGPLHYAERVAGQRPDLAFQVWRITRLYNTLRYAAIAQPGQDTALLQAVRAFKP